MEISNNQLLQGISSTKRIGNTNPQATNHTEKFAATTQISPIAPTQPLRASAAFGSLVTPSSLIDIQIAQQNIDAQQAAADPIEITEKSGSDLFLEYAEMSPEERIRHNMLAKLGYTEEEFEALPPEQKQAIEEEITAMIEAESKKLASKSVDQHA